MELNLSNGFITDLATMLQYCAENNGNSVDLEFDAKDKRVEVTLIFKVTDN